MGQGAWAHRPAPPCWAHTSSAMWGVIGCISCASVRIAARITGAEALARCSVLVKAYRLAMALLKAKLSIPRVTSSMARAMAFSRSRSPSPRWSAGMSPIRADSAQTRDKCLKAASAPALVHSTSRSGGLSDITNQRAVSAPNCVMMFIGSTTFFFDFDILAEGMTSTGVPSCSVAPASLRSTSSGR